MIDGTIKYFVMSASHDKSPSRELADKKITDSYKKYASRGAGCVSLKFQRAKDGLDENKFLMPFCRQLDVPVMVPQVINALEEGLNVAVVGSAEVGLVIEHLKHTFPEYRGRLSWTYEGDKTSLGNSINEGVAEAKRMGMGGSDRFCWVPLDMPFFHQLGGLRNDPDARKYGCVVDVNSKEVIFQDKPELFPRNYYHKLRLPNGRTVSFKEANVYTFSAELDFGIVNKFYQSRHAGEMGVKFFAKNLAGNVIKGGPIRLISTLGHLARNSVALMNGTIFSETSEKLGYYVFNVPLKIKAEHTDPFRLKDIDAWHDLWFYWHMMESAERKHGNVSAALSAIHPHADRIIHFNEKIKPIDEEIGVMRDFIGYTHDRTRTLSQYGINLPLPIDSAGRLLVPSSPGELVDESVSVLEKMCKTDS